MKKTVPVSMKKVVDLLKKARVLIKNARETYICVACSKADGKFLGFHYKESVECAHIRDIIQSRITRDLSAVSIELNGTTYNTWLLEVHGIKRNSELTFDDAYDNQIKLSRLAWIDSLIEEHQG